MSSNSVALTVEELTYVYETLHDRETAGLNSKKDKRLCKKIMKTIEEEILKVEEETIEESEKSEDDSE